MLCGQKGKQETPGGEEQDSHFPDKQYLAQLKSLTGNLINMRTTWHHAKVPSPVLTKGPADERGLLTLELNPVSSVLEVGLCATELPRPSVVPLPSSFFKGFC